MPVASAPRPLTLILSVRPNRSARRCVPVCLATCTCAPRPKGLSAARVLPAAVGSWAWRS